MAVNYVARKCTQCAGKLVYIKEKKIWKCLYCGAEIEREEQYDGLFTIKNVVRQVLLDVSYLRLESAAKNVVECEKIDSRYVGTLIAKIACQMITAITPGACEANDVHNLFAQLQRDYKALCDMDKGVTDEEQALYEFFDSADIYATLLLIFDSLGDTTRKDYISPLLQAGEVYSKETNKNLLRYSIKSSSIAMTDVIIANTGNIDEKFAVCEILTRYQDSENKMDNLKKLFAAGALKSEDSKIIDEYLKNSEDSLSSKRRVLEMSLAAGIRTELKTVLDTVVKRADSIAVKETLLQVCNTHLNDEEIYQIVDFALTSADRDSALAALACLEETDQFVALSAKHLIPFLSRGIDAEFKTVLLQKTLAFNIDEKSREAILENYLCFNEDPVSVRFKVIPILIDAVKNIATNTVETYTVQAARDGEHKPEIVQWLFDSGLNLSFFNDLLSKYLLHSADEKTVKDKVFSLLVTKGLQLDSKSLMSYIRAGADDTQPVIQTVKELMRHGSPLPTNAASIYLEQIRPEQYSPELFQLIFNPSGEIGEAALKNYSLFCLDHDGVKAQNVKALAERCHGSLPDIRCDISHLGKTITCNLLQAYMLVSADSGADAQVIVKYLLGAKIKINAEMDVSGEGSMKFKKYAVAHRGDFSALTNLLCEENRVYSMLF